MPATEKKHKRRDIVTTITLPPAMIDQLDALSERKHLYSRSAVVRMAIQEFLDRLDAVDR